MGGGEHSHRQPEEPTPTQLPYATPRALVSAISDRVAAVVAAGSVYNHDELRRHIAYDRLLARVFSAEPERWLLKGGGALLAQIPGARHSKDLTEGAALDLGDFFTFTVGEVKATLTGPTSGVRLPIICRIGPKQFGSFHIDVVVVEGVTAEPEVVSPLAPIAIPGLGRVPYRTYPLVDHLADKHAAMIETHRGRPSTRYRDLVDLVEVATTQTIEAAPLSVALFTKYRRRGLRPPEGFTSPGERWPDGYEALARSVPGFTHETYEEASAVAGALLDPILGGRTSGSWDPAALAWVD
jgi:hypothetical protein